MELWGWLAAYVALFALLQLLVYYLYLRRGDGGSVSAASGEGGRSSASATPSSGTYEWITGPERTAEEDEAENEDERVCTHCGAVNDVDPVYTYCRHCTRPLGP